MGLLRVGVVFLAIFILGSGFSLAANIKKSLPQEILLKRYFNPEPKLQDYGACHVYAATIEAEAACARRTGQFRAISPHFLFAIHLKLMAEAKNNYSFLRKPTSNEYSFNDAGYFYESLMRIQLGYAVLEQAYTIKNLDRALNRATQIREEFIHKYQSIPSTVDDRLRYEAKMREALAQDITASLSLSPSAARAAPSQCLFNFIKTEYFTPTSRQAKILLANGFPFVCQYVQYPELKGSGNHVVVVAGYRESEKPTAKPVYYVRDPISTKRFELRSVDCTSAAVMYYPEEERFIKSLNLGH